MIFERKNTNANKAASQISFVDGFKKSSRSKWAMRILAFFVLLAFFGDFIANDKPLFCKRNDKIEFPVIKSYLVKLGLANFDSEVYRKGWKELEYEKVVWPPIPYAASNIDLQNDQFVSPFGPQKVDSGHSWHILGTDQLGRDVVAGIIAGSRSALLVGLIAMGIASFIGIIIGSIAGFFGDHRIQFGRFTRIFFILGFLLGLFWFIKADYIFSFLADRFILKLFAGLILMSLSIFLFWQIGRLLDKLFKIENTKKLPVDMLVMRLIELINSIPGLLLILALVALVDQPNIYTVMVIIGFLSWTSIARYMRGELIKVKNLPFIQSVEAMGFSQFRVLFRHAIPNALGPVVVAIAFGMAGAILLEATLSFLGIATSPDQVTWGSLLNESRNNISAWWIAIIPGLMIFLLITSLNIIGDNFSGLLGTKKS